MVVAPVLPVVGMVICVTFRVLVIEIVIVRFRALNVLVGMWLSFLMTKLFVFSCAVRCG